ncbi:AI-2E family transporter [Marinobacter sp. C2H3]|uniref:AI-2E family transporter n=1 Tax=Marinobacter sp. C2H3 TaxID=3119003 RepID=UPI00300E7DBB
MDDPSSNPADPANEEPQQPRVLRDLTTPIYGLFTLGILYTLYVAHQIILPILLAMLLSLLLAPVVKKLYVSWRIPHMISALVLVVLVTGVIAGVGWAVATPALTWAQKAPESLSRLLVGEGTLMQQINEVQRSAEKVEASVQKLSDNKGAQPTAVVLQTDSWRSQLMSQVQSGLAGLALTLALTYFLLVSGDGLIRNFTRQLPRRHRKTVLRITHGSQREIARYLAVVGVSNGSVGVLTGLLCWGIGLPDPAVWGLVAGLARFIPYLGNLLTIGLLAVVSTTTLDTPWMMLLAPVSFVVLTTIVGFFLEPWIHGFRMAINPVIIFVSIFFWGWLWGPLGVLLAVPLMTVIQVVLKQIPSLRPVYRVIAR